MTVSVRLLAPFAAWLRPRARAMAMAAALGKPTPRKLIDGYILSAQRAGAMGIGSIIDTPTRFLVQRETWQTYTQVVGGPRDWYRYSHVAEVLEEGADDPRTAKPGPDALFWRCVSDEAELEGGGTGLLEVNTGVGFTAGSLTTESEGLGFVGKGGFVGPWVGSNQHGYLSWVICSVGGSNWYGHLSGSVLSQMTGGYGVQHRVAARPQSYADRLDTPFNATRYQAPKATAGRYPARSNLDETLKPLADVVFVGTASKSGLNAGQNNALTDWLHDSGQQGILLGRLALSERTLQAQVAQAYGYRHRQALDWATVLRFDQMSDPRLQPERWDDAWFAQMRQAEAEADPPMPAGSFVPKSTGAGLGWVRNTVTSLVTAYDPEGGELTAFFAVEFGRQVAYPSDDPARPAARPYLYLSWAVAAVRVTDLAEDEPVVHPVRVLFADCSTAPDNLLFATYGSGNSEVFSKPECLGAVYLNGRAVLALALESAERDSAPGLAWDGAIWSLGLIEADSIDPEAPLWVQAQARGFTLPGGPSDKLGGWRRATPPTRLHLRDLDGLLLDADPRTLGATAFPGNDWTWITDSNTGRAYLDAFPFWRPRQRVTKIADDQLAIGARAIGIDGQAPDLRNVGLLIYDASTNSLRYQRASPVSYYDWGMPNGTPCVTCYQWARQYPDGTRTPYGLILTLPPGNLPDDDDIAGNGSYLTCDGGQSWFKLCEASTPSGVIYMGQRGALRRYGRVYEEDGRG